VQPRFALLLDGAEALMNHFGFQQVIAYITFLPATKFARTA
jgi:hypothetical protein